MQETTKARGAAPPTLLTWRDRARQALMEWGERPTRFETEIFGPPPKPLERTTAPIGRRPEAILQLVPAGDAA
jgi:hypothetical protein